MKKIYLMLMLLMVGIAANATKRNIKLQVTILGPSSDSNIVTGSVVPPRYQIVNVGTDTLKAFDTLVTYSPANASGFITKIWFPSAINPGAGGLISGASFNLNFTQIESLFNMSLTTVYKPFTNNTRYLWYFLVDTIRPKIVTDTALLQAAGSGDTQFVWINKTSGINESFATSNESIKTYPNPASSQLSFEYNFTNSENATAKIMDVTGRTVFVKEFENNSGNQKFDLDINALNTGTYLLNFIVGDKTMTSKFNVQK